MENPEEKALAVVHLKIEIKENSEDHKVELKSTTHEEKNNYLSLNHAETFEKLDKIRKLAGELRYDFFEGFCFQFPGLSERVEDQYKNIVTFLGANKERALNNCSMITAKHYNDVKFKNLQIYYDIIYIDNCIQAKKILEIKDYQFPLIPQEQNIPRHIADNKFTSCLHSQPIKEENTDSSNTTGRTGNGMFPPKTKKIYNKNLNEDSSSSKRPKIERCNSQMNAESDNLKDIKICYCANNHFDNGGETSKNKCRSCFSDKNKNPIEERDTNTTSITNLANEGNLSKEVNGSRSDSKGTTVSFKNSNNKKEEKEINKVTNANVNSDKAIQNFDEMKERKIREYESASEHKRELSENSSNTSTAGVKRKKIVQNTNGRIDMINDSDSDVEEINHKKPNDGDSEEIIFTDNEDNDQQDKHLMANSKPGTSKAKTVDNNEKRHFQSVCQEAKQKIFKSKTNIKDNKITSASNEEKEMSSNESSTNDDINDSQSKDSDSESSDFDCEDSGPVWLQNLPLDKNKTCKLKDCTLSDKPHFRHAPISQIYVELPEQRLMIKFLVKNNCINSAKGFEVWKSMINEGYLKNRTHKTLQTHFRKILLPSIEEFELPKHIEQKFTDLRTEKEWQDRKDKNKKKR